MQLGMKVGLLGDSITDLNAVHPSFAEVWFYINKADDYSNLFDHLRKTHTDAGLHFWGETTEGFSPTICHTDPSIYKESVDLMKNTIDIASKHHFLYVNIHPGVRTKLTIDRELLQTTIHSDPVPIADAEEQFLSTIQTLSQYAKERGVLLTVETVNINNYDDWMDHAAEARQHTIYTINEMPLETLIKAAEAGIAICNDFAHTAGTIVTDSANTAWLHLRMITEQLLPATELIHLGFLIPPFNGTDFHDELDNTILETNDAVPNKKQMIELLQLFAKKDDIRILVEPKNNHQKNYCLAKKILIQAGVYTS